MQTKILFPDWLQKKDPYMKFQLDENIEIPLILKFCKF
jgi:hypothetical protein